MSEPGKAPRWIGWCSIAIFCVGSLQFVGYLLGNSTLRGLGATCGFAPYTKVFSDVDGFETFAADFSLLLKSADGEERVIEVTVMIETRTKGRNDSWSFTPPCLD